MTGAVLFYVVAVLAANGAVGYAIGETKGRSVQGFWLGLLFSVFGWIAVGLMSPTLRHELEVQDALGRTAPASESTAKRRRAVDLSRWNGTVLEEAGSLGCLASVQAAVETVNGVPGSERVSAWVIADGLFPLAVRLDGLLYLAGRDDLRKVGVDTALQYDADTAGTPTCLVIDGIELCNLRPPRQAKRLVEVVGARLRSTVEPAVVVNDPSGLPAPAGAVTAAVRPALLELRSLHQDGLITDEEFARKREEILRRL